MIDLSIGIVSYYNFDDVLNLVRSIEENTDSSIIKKIYIVDNADEESKYKSIIEKYNDVVYIKMEKNVGFGKAHNSIIHNLDSKYHAYVNPDILLLEDSFSLILEFLNINRTVGMVIPKIVAEDGDIQRVYRREITIWDLFVRFFFKKICAKRYAYHTMQDKDYSQVFQVPFGQGSFLVLRTELLKKLNGFDDRFFMYMEDVDLCKRVNDCSKLMYFPGTSVFHKWERGSHKNIKLMMIHIRSVLKYFRKWGCKWV